MSHPPQFPPGCIVALFHLNPGAPGVVRAITPPSALNDPLANPVCDSLPTTLTSTPSLSPLSTHPPTHPPIPQQVQIGAMQVDLSTLVWERRVAMRNVPAGSVKIHLSGRDMGNFVTHPLFQQAAATAVQVSLTL